jgi:formate dehydrogenase subunit gamma
MTADNPSNDALVEALIAQHAAQAGGLLPLLHAVQDLLGYVPASVVPLIAKALNLSRAEVHGVITYYHHFRQTPPGRHVVQVCQAEACQARGSAALMASAERILGCASHRTRADGAVSLEPVYCLGLCAQSPALMVGQQPHARMSESKLHRLATELGINA